MRVFNVHSRHVCAVKVLIWPHQSLQDLDYDAFELFNYGDIGGLCYVYKV